MIDLEDGEAERKKSAQEERRRHHEEEELRELERRRALRERGFDRVACLIGELTKRALDVLDEATIGVSERRTGGGGECAGLGLGAVCTPTR